MKRTQNQKIVNAIERLYEIREAKKQMEKEEKELKAQITEFMGSEHSISIGHLAAFNESKTRTSLDKKKLEAEIGDLTRFEKVTEYQTLSVKQA